MKRDWFSRGIRFSHQFGDTEKINDPLQTHTFDPPWPKNVSDLSKQAPGHPCEVQEYGEYNYRPNSSPIQKPNGQMANTDGPAPDMAQAVGAPIPVGTKRRFGPLKTDK